MVWSGKKDSGERTYDAKQQKLVRTDMVRTWACKQLTLA